MHGTSVAIDEQNKRSWRTCPVSLLRLSLLRFVDPTFPGNSPMDMRLPPLKIKIPLESNPPKSRILVRRLAHTHRGRRDESGPLRVLDRGFASQVVHNDMLLLLLLLKFLCFLLSITVTNTINYYCCSKYTSLGSPGGVPTDLPSRTEHPRVNCAVQTLNRTICNLWFL